MEKLNDLMQAAKSFKFFSEKIPGQILKKFIRNIIVHTIMNESEVEKLTKYVRSRTTEFRRLPKFDLDHQYNDNQLEGNSHNVLDNKAAQIQWMINLETRQQGTRRRK